jgi:hypothetical protein
MVFVPVNVSYETKLNSDGGMTMQPTTDTYFAFQEAYDFYNKHLFRGELPGCVITLQRKKNCYGYFHGDTWKSDVSDTLSDEIALNPDSFTSRSNDDVLSTLVHEMVHLQQHHFGQPSRSGYHNKQWAGYMKDVGLMPTSTGEEGGKQTGQRMTHYIIPGGKFAEATSILLEKGYTIPWKFIFEDLEKSKKKRDSKTKYTCPDCGLNAWGKPGIDILCGSCEVALLADV